MLRGFECGGRRPPDVTGGSSLPLPTEGERGAGGLGVVIVFLLGLLLLLFWTALIGEFEHEDDCLLVNPPLNLGEDGGMARRFSFLSGGVG